MDIIQDRARGKRPQRTLNEIIITVPYAGLHGSAEPSNLALMADGDVIAWKLHAGFAATLGWWLRTLMRTASRCPSVAKPAQFQPQSIEHCICAIERAVSQVAPTAATSTAITSALGQRWRNRVVESHSFR